MSALEQELFDKIRQMDEEEQTIVLEYIQFFLREEPYETWLQRIKEMRANLTAKFGHYHRKVMQVDRLLVESASGW